MKASVTQIVAAPAALIASAAPAARPLAGESAVRLGSLLPRSVRARAGDYAFLFFERSGSGGSGGQAYYAEPGAMVHADARLLTGSCQSDVLALPRVCGGSGRPGAADRAIAAGTGALSKTRLVRALSRALRAVSRPHAPKCSRCGGGGELFKVPAYGHRGTHCLCEPCIDATVPTTEQEWEECGRCT